MTEGLRAVVDLRRHPLDDEAFRARCRAALDREGALVLRGFLTPEARRTVREEGEAGRSGAWFRAERHNVYLAPPDPALGPEHPRNRTVLSSKGCITDDQVPAGSPLRALYDSSAFRAFLCAVLGERALHPYADPLSSINLHYAEPGQELGWHFDNSSFAVTLLVQEPEAGGGFEYVPGARDAAAGEPGYAAVARVLDGEVEPRRLDLRAGDLALFRGRDALHRVAPVEGARTRMLAVLAYNAEPGVALSESARMTFYGRLG